MDDVNYFIDIIVSASNLRVIYHILKYKTAWTLDLDDPNMHFTLLFEADTNKVIKLSEKDVKTFVTTQAGIIFHKNYVISTINVAKISLQIPPIPI